MANFTLHLVVLLVALALLADLALAKKKKKGKGRSGHDSGSKKRKVYKQRQIKRDLPCGQCPKFYHLTFAIKNNRSVVDAVEAGKVHLNTSEDERRLALGCGGAKFTGKHKFCHNANDPPPFGVWMYLFAEDGDGNLAENSTDLVAEDVFCDRINCTKDCSGSKDCGSKGGSGSGGGRGDSIVAFLEAINKTFQLTDDCVICMRATIDIGSHESKKKAGFFDKSMEKGDHSKKKGSAEHKYKPDEDKADRTAHQCDIYEKMDKMSEDDDVDIPTPTVSNYTIDWGKIHSACTALHDGDKYEALYNALEGYKVNGDADRKKHPCASDDVKMCRTADEDEEPTGSAPPIIGVSLTFLVVFGLLSRVCLLVGR